MTEKVRRELDALELLLQDHRELESLFREFEYRRQNHEDTGRVIAAACAELKIHDTLETSIFYVAIAEAGDDKELESLLAEAEEEQDTILELIEKLEHTATDDKARDAQFTVLAAYVKEHVRREETELFPMVNKLKLDLESITDTMKRRKARLIAELGITEADEEAV